MSAQLHHEPERIHPELPWDWAHRPPVCHQCGGPLPETSSPGRLYCSRHCRAVANRPMRQQAELDQARGFRRNWVVRRRRNLKPPDTAA